MTIPATAPPLSLFLGADPTVTTFPGLSSASRPEPWVSPDCVLPVTGTVGEGDFVADADVPGVCFAVPSSEVTRLSKLELLLPDGRRTGTSVPPADCDDVTEEARELELPTLRVVAVGSGAGGWGIGVNVTIACGGESAAVDVIAGGGGGGFEVIAGGGACVGGGVALAGGDVDSSAESSELDSIPSVSESDSASSRVAKRGTARRTPLPTRALAVADARGGRMVVVLAGLASESESESRESREPMEVADSAPEELASSESVSSAWRRAS